MTKINELIERCSRGDKLAATRLMTFLERGDKEARKAVRKVRLAKKPYTIGVTGEGGAGKSTIINALVKKLRDDGKSVGAILCDPVSPKTKGAVLGDRIRLQDHFLDPDVFIRSVATRIYRSGIASCVKDIVKVMGLMKKDVVIIETVGIGQQEIGVRKLVDTLVLVLKPDFGDEIQILKSGVREVSDILCVSKKSLYPAKAESLFRQLEEEVKQRAFNENDWCPRVLSIDAPNREGVDQLFTFIYEHWDYLSKSKKS